MRRGLVACAAALTVLASVATPSVAAPATGSSTVDRSSAPASPLVPIGGLKPLDANSDPAVLRAAADALGVPVAEITKRSSEQASRTAAALAGVVCTVGGSPPHHASATSNLVINTTVALNCTGPIKQATISIWLLYSLDNENFTTLSNRLNERLTGTLIMVGTTGHLAVCIPQYYIGLADIWVEFLEGYPPADGGLFITDSIFLDCSLP
jgi:hypothetical protein